MTFHVYSVTFPDRVLKVTTYVMPDGKAGAIPSHSMIWITPTSG